MKIRISRPEMSLGLAVIVGMFILLCSVFNFNPLARMRDKNLKPYCARNMAVLYEALKLYSQDYDGHFPASALSGVVATGKKNPYGWAEACAFTEGNYTMLRCPNPTSDVTGDPALRGYVSYWINGNIAGRRVVFANSPTKTLLVGEGDDGVDLSNAAYAKKGFPPDWLTNPRKPPFRHSGGANYLFVDGHVAWLRPDEIEHFGGRPDPFSLQ